MQHSTPVFRRQAGWLLTWMILLFGPVASASAVDLSGHWEGCWKSCSSGHEGPLQAEFCRISDDCYRVVFKGRFLKFLPFKYTVVLRVVSETEDSVSLAGSADLGRLAGGVYRYTATADGCTFHSPYCSSKDQGYFHLRRGCR